MVLAGHSGEVSTGVSGQGAFSPDGRRIVTLSEDKTLRVWNVDGTGEPAIMELLGVSRKLAEEQLGTCQARVAEAMAAVPK